jgi:hypothetical protein
MAGSVMLSPVSVPVAPGSTGSCTVRIRNTGVVVDQFTVSVLGDPAGWTTITPAAISLFPGAEGTVELHFAPPRTAANPAGPLAFGVRIDPTEDADNSVVEEGSVDLQPFTEIVAKLTPRTSETKRSAKHEILVENKGNVTIEAELEASDPDEQLAFDVKPILLTVAAGATGRATVKVAALKGFAKGTDKHRPFTATVSPGPGQPITRLDGMLIQHAGLPRLLFPAIAALCAIALIAFVAPKMLNKDPGSGSREIKLANKETPTTTIDPDAAAAAQDAKDAAEAQAAAEAEKAANGKDATVTTKAPSGAAASSGAVAAAPTTTRPNDGSQEAPAVTAAPAAPVTTAAPAAAPTTAPVTSEMYSLWKQENTREAHNHAGLNTIGQTFKATQPRLISAGLNLAGTRVVVNVRKGGPGGAIVATAGPVQIVSYGETTVTFAGSPTLTVGQIYYLEGVADGGTMQAWYSNTNDYADGDGFMNGAAHGHDMNGRVTGRSS